MKFILFGIGRFNSDVSREFRGWREHIHIVYLRGLMKILLYYFAANHLLKTILIIGYVRRIRSINI